jgi:ABC-2 type transport system permease protein
VSLLAATSSEWIKFRSVRSTLYALGATVVLCVGIGAIVAYAMRSNWQMEHLKEHLAFNPTRISLSGFFFAEIAIGVIGVLVMSSEYTSGLIRATLCATPHRVEVLVAKVVVLFCTTLVVGEGCSFVSFLVGQSIMKGATPTATLSSPGSLRAVVLAGLSLALLSLLALGIGTMLRHTAGAITIFVALLLVLLLIVLALPSSWNTHIFPYLPEVLCQSMRSTSSSGLGFNTFSPGVSTLVLAAYSVGSLIIGGVLLVRRDA